ncbi:formate dehydrogenase-N subunit alpha [Sesbania bispinosa]|nr:formate dehydrogenase-N subunit alpha [Sesbania bispinosa]
MTTSLRRLTSHHCAITASSDRPPPYHHRPFDLPLVCSITSPRSPEQRRNPGGLRFSTIGIILQN